MSTIGELFGMHTEPWMSQAICPGQNPEMFYPPPTDIHTERAAKRICHDCPVRTQCLTHAMEHDEPDGIWGGYTARERRELLRTGRPPTVTPQCGTYTGARGHYRRGEQTCPPCRRAAADQSRARRGERQRPPRDTKPPTTTAKCGTESGAWYHRQRGEKTCDACKQASTAARRRRIGITA